MGQLNKESGLMMLLIHSFITRYKTVNLMIVSKFLNFNWIGWNFIVFENIKDTKNI